MKSVVYGLILLLLILHQDFWFWDNSETLVFGFMPIGLAYHAGVSIAACVLWALAVKFCWPSGVDDLTDEPDAGQGGRCPNCRTSVVPRRPVMPQFCPECGARLPLAHPSRNLAE